MTQICGDANPPDIFENCIAKVRSSMQAAQKFRTPRYLEVKYAGEHRGEPWGWVVNALTELKILESIGKTEGALFTDESGNVVLLRKEHIAHMEFSTYHPGPQA
jgi:hypothetical protein